MNNLKNKTKAELISEILQLQKTIAGNEKIISFSEEKVLAAKEINLGNDFSNPENKERFRLLESDAPVLLRMTDELGNFIFFNRQWLHFTGKTLEQEINNGWKESIHKKDIETLTTELEKSLRKQRKFEVTYRLKKKNGEYAWMLETGIPHFDESDNFKGFLTSIVDVTQHLGIDDIRQQEQITQETEDKFHEAISNISLCGITILRDGLITFVNKYMLKVTGYKEEEVVGKNFFDIFVAKNEKKARKLDFEQAFQNQGLLSNIERTVLAKDGTTRYILFRSFILNNHLGEISGITRIGEDVTEKREFEKNLARTSAQLQDLFDNANDLILIISLKGGILLANKAWKNKLGYSDDEIKNLNIVNIVHPDHLRNTLRRLKRILKGENLTSFETVFTSKKGKSIFLEGSITCRYENNEPTAFRCILHDVTDKLRAEKAQQLYSRISGLITQSNNLEDLYHNIHLELSKIIDAENFYITLLNPENNYLYFPYYVDEELFDDLRITQRKVGKGLIEYGLFQQKSMILYEEDIEKLVDNDLVEIYNTMPKVWLGVPLKIENRITGLISLRSYKTRNTYNERDLELLDFISGQIALAIERKQFEERLSKQTAQLKSIFESGKHLMWSISRKYLLTSYNNNYADFLEGYYGIRPDMNNMDKVRSYILSDKYYLLWSEKYSNAFEGSMQYFEVKTRDKVNYKKVTWWEVYLNPIFLHDGTIEEVSAIAHDITEKKNAEIGLRNSEEKFRDIFESFQDIYYRSDLVGNISMISPSIYDELGYHPDEVITQKTELFLSDILKRKNAFQTLLKNGVLRNFEVELQSKTGQKTPFLLNIRLIYDENNKPVEVEGVARDITQLKKSAEELLKAKEVAEKSLRVKESFLANMSHEIRTPMNGIIGMIDLLTGTNLDEQQQDYVMTVKKSSETLLTILNDILDLSKIEAGKMSLTKAPVSLSDMIDKLYALFSQQANAKDNRLTYKIQGNVPKYVIADETRLLQILSNFTSNAIKFTENGKILIYVSLVTKKDNLHKIKVEVVDTGIGIDKEKHMMLFKTFSQIDNSSSKSYGGTGLGLAISKALVMMMHGEVGVDSVPHRGSTFWFTFEAEATNVNPSTLPMMDSAFTAENQFIHHKPYILLTDDNPINRKVATEILKKSGCEVETASSGEESIEKVKEKYYLKSDKKYDLIFMDIQMPDMDGVETTQFLKNMQIPDLPPIIAMTAYAMKEDKDRFLKAGMDDYLPKPIKANLLIQKVKEWMMRKSEPMQIQPVIDNWELIEEEKPTVENNINPEAKSQDVTIAEEIKFETLNRKVIQSLMKYAGPEEVKAILDEFAEEANTYIQESIIAFKNNEIKLILSNLHTLKGNAGTMGAENLSNQAMITEKKLKENSQENIENDLVLLEEKFNEFVIELEKLEF